MRTTPLLLALSLLTPAFAGCPPVRDRDDDDSSIGDDDDATAEELTLTEGYWGSASLTLISDSCDLPDTPGQLSFDLELVGGDEFTIDWGIDTAAACTGGTDWFNCPTMDFLVEDEGGPRLDGSIAFAGDILSSDSLSGTVDWLITCTGDCAAYDLPADTTCTFTLEGEFQPEDGSTDPDPDPEPPSPG